MKTRKKLEAENNELRAKLAVHDHVTRKALNAYVQTTRDANEELQKQAKAMADKIQELTAPKAA